MDRKTAEQTVRILVEALPYIQQFAGCSIVVKYGGAAMADEALKSSFARDLALMQQVGLRPVVVHGGGPQIGAQLRALGRESRFVDGLRVTDAETMEVVERVLGGAINAEIAALIEKHGGRAAGVTGKHEGFLRARPMRLEKDAPEAVDLGRTGTVEAVDAKPIEALEDAGRIPVIAPIGAGADGGSYNINADAAASRIAVALGAEKLIVLTDRPGVLDADGALLTGLDAQGIAALIEDGTIRGGMLPKVRCALDALEHGVHTAHIIDGRIAHAVLLEVFTRAGIGTLIAADRK